ncbi:MAG TPA: hypothetical protein VGS05_12895 [Candidatus Sulfotelmatobacter sp.]|nr:hypothetical protein [Candidatus Sulfotelmatobacter sp.]
MFGTCQGENGVVFRCGIEFSDGRHVVARVPQRSNDSKIAALVS